MSQRAGLIFPVSRCRRMLRDGRYAEHIGVGAAVYLTAVLEYLVAELAEIAGNAAEATKRKRLTPRHVLMAVKVDEELSELLGKVTIPQGGVVPFIDPSLLPQSRAHKKRTPTDSPKTT